MIIVISIAIIREGVRTNWESRRNTKYKSTKNIDLVEIALAIEWGQGVPTSHMRPRKYP